MPKAKKVDPATDTGAQTALDKLREASKPRPADKVILTPPKKRVDITSRRS